MFFLIPEMPSKTFVMVYKKLPDHFKLFFIPFLFVFYSSNFPSLSLSKSLSLPNSPTLTLFRFYLSLFTYIHISLSIYLFLSLCFCSLFFLFCSIFQCSIQQKLKTSNLTIKTKEIQIVIFFNQFRCLRTRH